MISRLAFLALRSSTALLFFKKLLDFEVAIQGRRPASRSTSSRAPALIGPSPGRSLSVGRGTAKAVSSSIVHCLDPSLRLINRSNRYRNGRLRRSSSVSSGSNRTIRCKVSSLIYRLMNPEIQEPELLFVATAVAII